MEALGEFVLQSVEALAEEDVLLRLVGEEQGNLGGVAAVAKDRVEDAKARGQTSATGDETDVGRLLNAGDNFETRGALLK